MLSYFSRWAIVATSPRSFAATMSRSAPDACTARKKFRPIRPNPLMPTRTVTGAAPCVREVCVSRYGRAAQCPSPQTLAGAEPWSERSESYPPVTGVLPCAGSRVNEHALLSEHLGGHHGLGVRQAQLGGPLVGHREQAPDPARHRILGHRRVGAG